jgi:hypothetical protein
MSEMKDKFNNTGLIINDNVYNYSLEIQESILKYLNQMDDKERKAYTIAQEHLETSFNIVKSIGYIEWKKKN